VTDSPSDQGKQPDVAASQAANAPAAPPPRRARYQQKQRSFWQRVPLSVWILLPVAIASASWFGYRAWKGSRTVVTFVGIGGAPVPPLELQLFAEQLSFHQPSPPAPYATRKLDEGDTCVFGSEEVDRSALLRYSGPGIGTGYASITRGRQAEIRLAAPTQLQGRVGAIEGVFAMGLRTLGMQPVAGARVIGMGGGEHGLALCEAVTDADGRFALAGFSSDLGALFVRVLADGYSLASSNQFLDPNASVVVPMLPTKKITGRVALPAGLDASRLRVLAKGLPGVEARIAADGAFSLDHVPPQLEPRLLVHGLPIGFTHAQVNAHAGQDGIAIAIVPDVVLRGRVVERMRQLPMSGAMVWHDCGPIGGVTVHADEDGRFEIRGAPPGEIVLRAQCMVTTEDGEKETLSGERSVPIEAGKQVGEVILRID